MTTDLCQTRSKNKIKIISVHDWLLENRQCLNCWTLTDKQYKGLLIFLWRDSLREQRSPSMRHGEAYLCPPLPVDAGLKCQKMPRPVKCNITPLIASALSSQKFQEFPFYYNRLYLYIPEYHKNWLVGCCSVLSSTSPLFCFWSLLFCSPSVRCVRCVLSASCWSVRLLLQSYSSPPSTLRLACASSTYSHQKDA